MRKQVDLRGITLKAGSIESAALDTKLVTRGQALLLLLLLARDTDRPQLPRPHTQQ